MPRDIQAVYVAGRDSPPTVITITPTALEYSRLFGHKGLSTKMLLPSTGSAFGETLYSISDAKFRGFGLSRTVTPFPDTGSYSVYGPFLIVGAAGDQEVSLTSARIAYWLSQLQLQSN
jgi:hypothetical protein